MLQFFRVLGVPEGFFVRECPGAGCLWAPDSGGTMGLRRGSGSLACHPVLPQPPGSFQDMPSRSSNSHTASRLSFTLGRRGPLRFISRVPSPGIAGRTGRGTHCFRPGSLSCLPMCAGFSVAQKELGGSPEPVYPPGPPTVDTNSSDSILLSLERMAPSSLQSSVAV